MLLSTERRASIKNEIKEKVLLNLDEFCIYLSIGKTKARELLKDPKCSFSIRIGNRIYANKKVLDLWIDSKTGNE